MKGFKIHAVIVGSAVYCTFLPQYCSIKSKSPSEGGGEVCLTRGGPAEIGQYLRDARCFAVRRAWCALVCLRVMAGIGVGTANSEVKLAKKDDEINALKEEVERLRREVRWGACLR